MANVLTFIFILLAKKRKSELKYSGTWKEHFSFLEVAYRSIQNLFLRATEVCHQGRHFYNLNEEYICLDDENNNP